MDEFKEGAWVELTSNYYHSYLLRKGMVGYVDGIERYKIGFRPVSHPDGKPINVNLRRINKGDVTMLPVELGEQELDCLIDIALSEKDERTFRELWDKRFEKAKELGK